MTVRLSIVRKLSISSETECGLVRCSKNTRFVEFLN